MPDQYQCRNCAAYVYPDAAVYLDVFDAYYHRPTNNPMLPCGPLRALGPRCGATTWLTGDEDGPLPRPIEIFCKHEAGHLYDHFNGYACWAQDMAGVPVNDGGDHASHAPDLP